MATEQTFRPLTANLLRSRAVKIMTDICNVRDNTFASVVPLVHPSVTFTHDDYPPNPWNGFVGLFTNILENYPDFHCEVKDVIAQVDEDGRGGKAWVFSVITGHIEGTVDSIDMMRFNQDGLLIASKDVQRKVAEKDEVVQG